MTYQIPFSSHNHDSHSFLFTTRRASDVPLLQRFLPLQEWRSMILSEFDNQEKCIEHPFYNNPKHIEKVEIVDVRTVRTKSGADRVMFVTLNVFWKNPDMVRMLFLKGPTVAMMIVLQPNDVAPDSEEDKHVVLTVQPRPGSASLQFIELPAGMLDDSHDFVGSAVREIEEEVGIQVLQEELIELKPPGAKEGWRGMFPGPGALDESVKFYLHQRRVPRIELEALHGKRTGLMEDGEEIVLKIVRLEDMLNESNAGMDGKAHSAWSFYTLMRADEKGRRLLLANVAEKSLE